MLDKELLRCENCDTSLEEGFTYCPNCGQKNRSSLLPFKEVVTDFLGATFSFDTKIFRTVPRLLFQPGKLTNLYLEGKRQSFLPPFRLYLFLSVVLFLLLPFVVSDNNLFEFSYNGAPTANIDITTAENAMLKIQTRDSSQAKNWYTAVKMYQSGRPMSVIQDSLFSDASPINQFFLKQGIKFQAQKGQGLSSIFLNTFSYSLFIFLPLFALIVKLLYVRRKRLYVEHFIFALHCFSFLFVLIILSILVGFIKLPIPFWVILLLFGLYLFLALKKVYKQNWGKTFLKETLLVAATGLFLAPVFLIVILLISAILY